MTIARPLVWDCTPFTWETMTFAERVRFGATRGLASIEDRINYRHYEALERAGFRCDACDETFRPAALRAYLRVIFEPPEGSQVVLCEGCAETYPTTPTPKPH